MVNIYRVLENSEYVLCSVINKIHSNSEFYNNCFIQNFDDLRLSDNLDNIISHVQHGNTTCSRWISCSKSLVTDLEKYAVSNLTYKKTERPKVAVIRNHDKSSLYLKDLDVNIFDVLRKSSAMGDVKEAVKILRNMPISKLDKVVIDLNDTDLLVKLFNIGFIRTKGGKIPNLDSRAFNYARNAKEVVVLSKIENKYGQNRKVDIPCILDPIIYDVLYALFKNNSISDDMHPKMIEVFIKMIRNFPIQTLSKQELGLYRSHYRCNQSLEAIIQQYNDSRLDVLSLHQELLKIKRSIIYKIVDWMNKEYSKNYNKTIYLIDDNSLILRSSGTYQNVYAKLVDGTIIDVPPLDDTNSIINNSDITNKISLISSCGDDDKFYTMYDGTMYQIPGYSLNDVKKHIKYIKK